MTLFLPNSGQKPLATQTLQDAAPGIAFIITEWPLSPSHPVNAAAPAAGMLC